MASKRKKTAKRGKKLDPITLPSMPSLSREMRGLTLLAFSTILLLSLLSFSDGDASQNLLGLLGHIIAWVTHWTIGTGAFLLLPFLGWIGWRLLFDKPINRPVEKAFLFVCCLFSYSLLSSAIAERWPGAVEWLFGRSVYSEYIIPQGEKNSGLIIRHYAGGVPAYWIYLDLPGYPLRRLLNDSGLFVLFGFTFFLTALRLTKLPLIRWIQAAWSFIRGRADRTEKSSDGFFRFVKLRIPFSKESDLDETQGATAPNETLAIRPETELKVRPSLSKKTIEEEPPSAPLFKKKPKPSKAPARPAPENRTIPMNLAAYTLPAGSLLSVPKKVDQTELKKNLRRQAEVLEETLASFGIEAKVGQINCGPTITSFEVHPSIGVKVQKIRSLEHDIALNMEARSIRIIAPIPGKAAVGIEVPNADPQEVSFREMLTTYQQGKKKHEVPVLLGKTVQGDHVTADLAKMPHCVIAGATGSGKSVCINTIVMSIIMNRSPDEVRLLMIDPKKVELTPYSRLPHMIAPVITEPGGACEALNWLVKEMERRYEMLKCCGVRNIIGFNKRKRQPEIEATYNIEIPETLPYMIGIVDELADLMMVAQNDIETPIARIAQMARAVGIHLILATQRPSREVITGLIKANFPTRIAFKVSSRINSQIVLDETGAESLLGNGDLLFLPPGTSTLLRAQGAFIRDEDINQVIEHIERQAPPSYLIKSFDAIAEDSDSSFIPEEEPSPADALYDQALQTVLEAGSGSTSFLQRKLKIGYSRAASLIDQMEEHGVLSPAEGSKPRQVLKPSDSEPEFETMTEL